MTNVRGEIRISAPQKIVWKVLADLGAVSTWNPVIADSYYTSETKEGVGASRHCDFPDGGYVNERATEWEAETLLRLQIYEGTVPFDDYYGTYSLTAFGDATLVSFTMEYEIQPNTSLDPDKVEQRNRERFIPSVLEGLKHHIDNGLSEETSCSG